MALSLSAGYLDAFTYVGHGQVFASAMTGNMVLLGIHLADRTNALTYLYPIMAYIVGVITANVMMRERFRRYFFGKPHVVTLMLEITVLLGLAFLPMKLDDRSLVAIITINTAMQNTSFRTIGTRTYNSVIMTGNLQAVSYAVASGIFPFSSRRLAEALDLGAILVSFVVGASLGAWMTPLLGLQAIVVPAGLLSVGAVILLLSDDGAR